MLFTRDWGGGWTSEKLEILRRYLDGYTTALKRQRFELVYIDAFAGPGTWESGSGYGSNDYADFEAIHKGSPLIAAEIGDRPFDRLVFIEKDSSWLRTLSNTLQEFIGTRRIEFHSEDANDALPDICRNLDEFERAVVFLDPFATQVSWSTVEAIADSKKADCWILFPRMLRLRG